MSPRLLGDYNRHSGIRLGVRYREPAVDFLSAHEAGLEGVPDYLVLARAAELGRILVTHDYRTMPEEFSQFLQTASSPGVLIVRQSVPVGRAIEELLLIWSATEAGEWIDRICEFPI